MLEIIENPIVTRKRRMANFQNVFHHCWKVSLHIAMPATVTGAAGLSIRVSLQACWKQVTAPLFRLPEKFPP